MINPNNRTNGARVAVIVAGGSGRRMGSELPKQFMLLAGRPVLMRTLDAFLQFDAQLRLIVVIPETFLSLWQTLCAEHRFDTPHLVATGGEQRFYSVKNALTLINDNDLVAVHDGVRPFVSTATLKRCFEEAERSGAAVAALPLTESLRQETAQGSRAINREGYFIVQTPQVFRGALLKQACEQPFTPHFTDDASVVEALGHRITMVEGNRENIKITTPFDLLTGETFLSSN
ncbi:MAG: 2-C-methyl-D-erythritol 4-phosphate cytidylyltransferase [Prevotellaceae bacterium]|jgi:2-C-methyl-D-erythritol 4-phosphate cytidylyltransferase|nr:2-C-methyl-D-erythritol 4-phosphate cytidylyltransferase [Prevotellaceae bacterium]